MLDDIVKNLKILCDYKINDLAAMNIIQAKLTHAFSLKDVKFQSIQNVGKPRPIAYYAFNFVPSGGVKNLLESIIDDHLLSFVDTFLEKYNKDRLEKLEGEQILELQNVHDKVELRRKKQEQELQTRNFKRLHKTITNATQAKLYSTLDIIKKTGYGSAMVENTEFANYFEDAIIGRDKTKKELLDTLYNLYDGEFQATDTVSTSRESIKGIPVSGIFLSDYKLMNENEKLANAFKSYLARGMARRSFIFFKQNENYYTTDRVYPTFDEKQEAIEYLKNHCDKIKSIFDMIPLHKEFHFDSKANQRINEYKQEVDKKIAEFYKYTNKLNLNNDILKINLEHSTWKIIKLAVLYHILDTEGHTSLIKVDSFNKAIAFFNKTHDCLYNLLNDKSATDYDNLYNYLIENRNKWVSKTDLRSQKFVPNKEFKTWFEDAMTAVSELAEQKKFCIASRATGSRNQGLEITLYEPDIYAFNSIVTGNVIKGELVKINNNDLIVNEI